MRILLRHSKTGRFYCRPKQWTEQREKALTFRSGGDAVQLACREELEAIEIFYDFGDPRFELQVALYPSASEPAAAAGGKPSRRERQDYGLRSR